MSTYLELDKELTPEQGALKNEVHRFAEEVMRPASIELDRLADPEEVIKEGSVLWDVFGKFYELGYHCQGLPEALGGVALSGLDRHIVAEEIGWGSADLAISLGVAPFPFAFAATFAGLTGNQQAVQEIVVPFAQDKEAKYIGCWAITEPQHGSDSLLLGTEQFLDPRVAFDVGARPDGDDWVINGQKSAWVSNATIASHALTFVAIDPSQGMAGSGVAVIPLDLPGVSKGRPLNKLGQRALNQGEIFFDDVRIPKHYMLVEPPIYPMVIDMVLGFANSGMGAAFTGVARAAFEEALAYCKQRVQGGKPICEHQLVQMKLFDMFIKVESARALSRAVMIYNDTTLPPATHYSIAAKVYCTNVAFEVANEAVQLLGGMGLSKELLVEKLFRDARASLIEDGTNEVLSLTGANQLISKY
ncbi:MAG: acyl-CoA dehydrogenase [Dehalococcoidia bacterium SM23_28_2]|nr:MAG: acyl-CoA dehydrogenase [Dehalococcoidia bacterium SM23_28_2]